MKILQAAAWHAMIAVATGACPAIAAPALPPDFQKTLVFKGLAEPVCLEFLPDWRPIIAERQGKVVIINGASKATVLQLTDVTFDEEWGLLGMALDPQFAVNGHLYVYYTTASAGHLCRVSRFTVVDDVASPLSEAVIWQNPEACGALSHHGGCIRFGPDGKLYIATGEEFMGFPSQDLASQRGKILRINPDGTVPPDNPYVNTPGADPRVWAYGLRNPFRFTFDASGGRLYVGDVGFSSWEEIDLVEPTRNYGWPNMEGPLCFIGDCSAYTVPRWAYAHGDPDLAPHEECAVILGPVYRATQFPPQFNGSLFAADHVNGWLRALPLDASGNIVGNGTEFDRAPDLVTVTDIKVGPDGALYYVSIFDGEPNGQMLWRIAHIGPANSPPVPAVHALPRSAPEPPLTVHFSALGSYDNDPDGPPGNLTFVWDFGDGESATGMIVDHTYTAWGRHFASVTVSDGELAATSPEVAITIGHPPQPAIQAPAASLTYRAGDVITFSGTAFDADDGDLAPGSLSWSVVIVHDTHVHPFLGPISGPGGQFTIPESGHTPEHVVFRISLTATDSDLITTTVERTIHPVIAYLALATEPPGISVFVDNTPQATPTQFQSLPNFHHAIAAQVNATVAGDPWHFTGWSTGDGLTFEYITPEGGALLTATYAPGCAADVNGDTFVTGDDADVFFADFDQGLPGADLNRDGFVSGDDADLFAEVFEAGC